VNDPLRLLQEPLVQLGFRRRTTGIYTLDLGHEVLGWLGLNKATRHYEPGRALINPIVGVRHQRVERLVSEILGERVHEYVPPTVSTPIYSLMDHSTYTEWILGGPGSQPVLEALVAAVRDRAVPFMRDHIDLTSLLRAIEAGLGYDLDYRKAVVLAEMGRSEAAKAFLTTGVDSLQGRQDDAAQRLRTFAKAFANRPSS